MRVLAVTAILALLALAGCSQSPTPAPTDTPWPEPTYAGPRRISVEAQVYAEQYNIDLAEAVRRMELQEPIRKLEVALVHDEIDTFGGLLIQHEPEYRVIAAFTGEGEETIAKYVQDGPLAGIIEVRTVDVTYHELVDAMEEAGWIVAGLGFRLAHGVNVLENRAEVYVRDKARLEEALERGGQELPEYVVVIERKLPVRPEGG